MVIFKRAKIFSLMMIGCLSVMAILLIQGRTANAGEQRLKSKLGCVPFVAGNIEAMAFTEYLTTVLLNELDRTGAFEVIERKRLEGAMELEGIRSDLIGREQLQRLGARLGAEFLVNGTVASQPQGMLLEISALGLRTQKFLLTEKLRMNEADAPRILQQLAVRIKDAAYTVVAPADSSILSKPLRPAEGLEAVGSTNTIRLSWKHSEPARIVGYMVQRAAAMQGPFNMLSTVTESAYSDEQLRLNETYYYRVISIGQGGVASEPTTAVKGETSVAPAVPIFMNLEPILGGAVITWRQRPCAGADERTLPKGVRIYRRKASDKEFAPVARVADLPSIFTDSGLQDGTAYLYSMTAYNQAGAESEQSVQLSVTTPPETRGLTALSQKVRRVPISWQVHPFAGVSGYRIMRATVKEGSYKEIAVINDRQITSYLDNNLTDKTTYWYRIIATSKEQGNGGASAEVSAVTRDLPPVPVKLTATQGEPRRVTLSWDSAAQPDDELTGFYLYRGEQGQDKLTRIAELTADKRAYRDDSEPLKDAFTYSYIIASFNAGGAVSPLSERVNATTKALPTKPQGLNASSNEPRRISLKWDKNPENDIKEYIVFRQEPGSDFKELKRSPDTRLVDSELKDGVSYLYQIQAVDKDGLTSIASDSVKGATKQLPRSVDGLQMRDKATRLIVWQKSVNVDIKRYHIYKKGFMGGQKLATVETNEWRVTEPGKLEFYVTAEDADGLESEPSAVLAVE